MNIVKDAKRIVVEIGSSTLTHENFRMNLRRIEALTRVLSEFKKLKSENGNRLRYIEQRLRIKSALDF